MNRILIVDDSATSRLLFRAHLPSERTFQVDEAQDVASALARAGENAPDLVVLDYNMPESNGVEIGQALRAAGVTAKLVLLTANTQQSVVNAATEAGFSSVLEKPITREKLADLLGDG